MVKDIKYIIKRILIGIGIAIALMWLKGGLIANVNALSMTAYDSNYTVVGSCDNCTSLVPDNLAANIERLYIKFDNTALTSGTKYTLETTYEIISLDQPRWDSPYFYISGTNQNIQLKYNAINGSQGNVPIPGGLYGSKYNIGYVGDFTASKSGNGGLLEIYFTNRPYFSQIKILTSSFAYNGDSSIDAINNQTNMIINNQNNNTNSIINNNNNNTQSIINNQNANTDKEIESQQVCKTIQYSSTSSGNTNNQYLNSSGVPTNGNGYSISEFISISNSSNIKVINRGFNNSCFYDSNKNFISCVVPNSIGILSVPTNAKYFRITFNNNDKIPIIEVDVCKNGNQALDDSITDTNNTLKDSSIDDPSSDIDTMKGKLASNGVITQLITLPVTLYQSVLNNINGSCSTFNLGSLYNHNLSLPCIQPENYLGSSLWGVIDVLCCGLFILSFRKRMVDIFNHMSSLKDRGNELE